MGVKVDSATLSKVNAALEQYKQEVEASRLSYASKSTYLRHATTFVRWLNGDFTPGERV